MRAYKRFLLIFLLLGTSAIGRDQEADFIDEILAHQNQTFVITDLAQEKGTNLELKRFLRKLTRDDKREQRRLLKWRTGYYLDVPMTPDPAPPNLADLNLDIPEGNEFDLNLLDNMITLHERGRKLMSDVAAKSKRTFLREFAKNALKEIGDELRAMHELRAKIELEG